MVKAFSSDFSARFPNSFKGGELAEMLVLWRESVVLKLFTLGYIFYK